MASAGPASADEVRAPQVEERTIEALIASVARLTDATFVRNGESYSASDATRFLREKWRARRSDVHTAEDFIDRVASFSSTTGKPYLIRYADGREVPSAQFLRAELAELGGNSPCAPDMNVFYDERHSFRVSAPPGWCCGEVASETSCAPAGSRGAAPGIRVGYRYLTTPDADLNSFLPEELTAIAPAAATVEQAPIATSYGSSVRVWQVTGPDAGRHRRVGLLVHEFMLMRFVLEASPPGDRASEAEAFRHLVASFRSNLRRSAPID